MEKMNQSMERSHAITHQKHLTQSGCSMQSEVDIFDTLRIFLKEPIREQEFKLEQMNQHLLFSQ